MGSEIRIMIIEEGLVEVAREVRARFREKHGGRDLVEELIHERERFGG